MPRERQSPGQPGRATAGRGRWPRSRTSSANSRAVDRDRARSSSSDAAYAPRRRPTGGPGRRRRRTRARPGPRAGPRRTPAGSVRRSWSSMRSRTPRPLGRRHPPDPDRVRDVAEMEVAGRGRREPGPAAASGVAQRQLTSSPPGGRARSRSRSRRFQRARRGHQPAVEGQQVGLGKGRGWPSSPAAAPRAPARHRGSRAARRRPWPGRIARQLGPFVDQSDEAPVSARSGAGAGAARRLGCLGRLARVDRPTGQPSADRPCRPAARSTRAPGGTPARPGRDRLERDVVEEVDLPEGLPFRRIRQVDLDERPLDRRATRRAGRRWCGSTRRH